ncbi:hypothetical protein OH492_02620 [Vibrio chagasii]|nr:hypothetical protein [Vibrio chagasii]
MTALLTAARSCCELHYDVRPLPASARRFDVTVPRSALKEVEAKWPAELRLRHCNEIYPRLRVSARSIYLSRYGIRFAKLNHNRELLY